MLNSDRLSAPKTPSAPFLTLQISRGAAWMFLAVFTAAAAAALLLPKLREQSTTAAAAPASPREALAATPTPPAQRQEQTPSTLPSEPDGYPPPYSVDPGPSPDPTPEPDPLPPPPPSPTRVVLGSSNPNPNLQNLQPQPSAAPDPQPAAPDPPAPPVSSKPTPPSVGALNILGAGTAFPSLLYAKWFADYDRAHRDVAFQYQPVGNGAGIHMLLEDTSDFAGTDIPLSDDQLAGAKTKILHVPTALGAVVFVYNLPGPLANASLQLTPEILAGIFSGRIVSWDDPALVQANPAAELPRLPIVVMHRSDGSAPTFVLTDYLSKVSAGWRDSVGAGMSVNWPVGLGGKGNEGVAELIHLTQGAIGYVDRLYAGQNRLVSAAVRNSSGNFVNASPQSLTEAAATADIPADFRASITNAPGRNAYPIASFTWLLVPQKSSDPVKANDLTAFLRWTLDQGQQQTEALGYGRLPKSLTDQLNQLLAPTSNRQHPR